MTGYYANNDNQLCFKLPTTMEEEAAMLAEWNNTNPEEEFHRLEEAADLQAEQDNDWGFDGCGSNF